MGFRKIRTFNIPSLWFISILRSIGLGLLSLLILGLSIPVVAQSVAGYISGNEPTKSSSVTNESINKCLTPFLKNDSLATQRFGYRLDQWPNQIAGAISTNQRQEYLSTSGNFSIHYVTEGVDAVPNEDANENGIPDFVEWAAEAQTPPINFRLMN